MHSGWGPLVAPRGASDGRPAAAAGTPIRPRPSRVAASRVTGSWSETRLAIVTQRARRVHPSVVRPSVRRAQLAASELD